MGKFDRFCQSCGMPMEKDLQKGGTNKDGSRSSKYCSYCFNNGEFNGDFKTSKEMIRFVKDKLKEQGFGCIKRWFYTSHISHLERWKK